MRLRVSLGCDVPAVNFMLGYPDVLDPYCARGIVWCGSAKSTAMLSSGHFTLRDGLHPGVGPSVLDGLGVNLCTKECLVCAVVV